MSTREKRRGPAVLKADDPALEVSVRQEPDEPPLLDAGEPAAVAPQAENLRRGIRWGGIFLTAFTGLLAVAAGLWMEDFARRMLARQDWLGWATLALLATAGFAAAMVLFKEIWALMRLKKLGKLRHAAESAVNHGDRREALEVAGDVNGLYAGRAELAWARARLAEHSGDILDARERLVLTERELLAPLDGQASAIIAASARRVSVITAVSPSTLTDMIAVAVLNMRMLRQIAAAYGARPGTLGLFRLARMVLSHIVLTGGIAIGDDLIQQLVGQRLTAKLSARLGEGVFNGALTARIGLATMDVCRPLPFIEARRPRFRDLLSLVVK